MMQKRKLVALLLLMAMLFTLLPTAAMAETEAATVSITASEGAAVQLLGTAYKTTATDYGSYDKINNYVSKAYSANSIVDNQDGTKTHTFQLTDQDKYLTYRVSMKDYITKAGYIKHGDSVRVVYNDADLLANVTPTVDDWMDDSVLLNVNEQNHLKLKPSETFRLKDYRNWQIVDSVSNNNIIIEPDFHYKILSGEDVISIEPVISGNGNATGNWLDITAKQEGTAIVEVSYDAIDIANGSYPGIYGPTGDTRTGLVVVQVGADTAHDVAFGIDCYSSDELVYDGTNIRPWDSEFDTLYFIGDMGELQLNPTVTTGSAVTISKLEVSHDNGEQWAELQKDSSSEHYVATIVAGNNLIRATKSDSTTPSAYQLVRGEKVDVKLVNQSNPGKNIAAGDTVRIVLDGLHQPIGKMATVYNPCSESDGWGNPDWATSAAKLSYLFDNGDRVLTQNAQQYAFSTENNYLTVTLPKDGTVSHTFTAGYISGDYYGYPSIVTHRTIPETGIEIPSGIFADTVHYTRSILPDITVTVGQQPSANGVPELVGADSAQASIELGKTYFAYVNQFFKDVDHDALTYTVSVNGAAAQTINADYEFKPSETGEYELVFKANDGQADSPEYTVTLTVTGSGSSGGGGDTDDDIYFDMDGQPIAGYITMSVVDNAKRPAGSNSPVALGTIIAPVDVPYAAGETVAGVTLRLLDAYHMKAEYAGSTTGNFYLASIETSDGSLGEFDAGSGSGWMFTCDGVFPEVGAADILAETADTVCWKYTSALGEDIGGGGGAGTVKPEDGKVLAELPTTGTGVTDLIGAIGAIDKNSGEVLKAAREAYDKLSEEEKKLVENYDQLVAVEREYQRLTSPLPFADVPEKHWAQEAIHYIYSKDLMRGVDDNQFAPEAEVNRAMLVTMLYRLEGTPTATTSNSFADVADNSWYTESILWASANHLVSGYGKNQFGPEDGITREQLAVVLLRYSQYKNYDTGKTADLSRFADGEQISSWAAPALTWANAEGLITGRGKTTMAPQGTVTRAEAAAILMRYMQTVDKDNNQ